MKRVEVPTAVLLPEKYSTWPCVPENDAPPPVVIQVPLMEKQPAVRLMPAAAVLVALEPVRLMLVAWRPEEKVEVAPALKVKAPVELSMVRAALVDVAEAVEVARKNVPAMERIVQALLEGEPSVRAICGRVEEETVRAVKGELVPMPTLPPLKIAA